MTGLLVARDFNLPEIDWSSGWSLVRGGDCSAGFRFAETFDDLYWCQSVCKPTFNRANGHASNVLDLVLSESDGRVGTVDHGPGLGCKLQAHQSLRWSYQLNDATCRTECLSRRNYVKGQYEEMNAHFMSTDWHTVLQNKPLDEAYTAFVNKIKQAEEMYIPVARRKPGKSAPWITSELKALTKRKRSMWYTKLASGGKDAVLNQQYKEVAKLVKQRMRKAVQEYERSLAEDKVNPKRIYHYIKMRQRVKQGLSALQEADGMITDPTAIVNSINEHFASCFVAEPPGLAMPDFPPRTEATLHDCPFIVEDVVQRLTKLDASKSPGDDGVYAAVLKHCAPALALPLCLLFRRSLDEGALPSSWSEANVTPLFKKGDKKCKNNYRPISLTSVVCKAMERVIRDRIMSHLLEHRLLDQEQHGFVPRRSCTTNLLESADLLTKVFADRGWLDVLYLDFAKAFDTVSHRKLLVKLEAYGISGNILRWIRQFLSNRKQRVVVGDCKSQWSEVTSGVPQGSVLGPLLFVIYINDLPEISEAICKLYADDTKLFSSDAAEMQRGIDNIVDSCYKWLMALNVDKCHVLHVGKSNPRTDFSMETRGGRHEIASTQSERDLGVIVSKSLKVGDHVHMVAGKANAMLGLLKKTFVSRDTRLWKKLYTVHVRPLMEYAVQAWSPHQRGDVAALERVQRRATKVPSALHHLPYEERLTAMGILSLEDRRLRGDLIQRYKLEKGMEEISWHFPPVTGPQIGGRRGQVRREIVISCAQRHKFFNNRVAGPWNELPDKVVAAPSLNCFKSHLDSFYEKTGKYKYR